MSFKIAVIHSLQSILCRARLTDCLNHLLPFLVVLPALITGCSRTSAPGSASHAQSSSPLPTPTVSPTASPRVATPPLSDVVATLEDETRDLSEGQIIWTTYWKLCWTAYPGATAYELETMTGEGARRKLRRQTETCLRVEVAKGRNEKAKGLFNRDLMLASISGQLSYRVRARLDGNRVSEWSPLMEVGRPDSLGGGAPASSKKSSSPKR